MNFEVKNFIIKNNKVNIYEFYPTKPLNNKLILDIYQDKKEILIELIHIETIFLIYNNKTIIVNKEITINSEQYKGKLEILTSKLNNNSIIKITLIDLDKILDQFNNNKEKVMYLINNNKHDYIFNLKIDYSKINFIDKILWINLEISKTRRKNMENLLKNISLPNTRIDAIDGRNIKLPKLNFDRSLTKYEFACLLSHIKAITSLKDIEGDYFMICEDDMSLNNTILFTKDLKEIIKNCPIFDILILQSTYFKEFNNEYEKWSDYYIKKPLSFVGCTGSYIISRSGINKITDNVKFIDDNNFIFNDSINKINTSDIYLYKLVETYIYKYNFITANNNESTINNKYLKEFKKRNNIQRNNMIRDIHLI
jgi:GR25 family glycosyltransferase involved in LPS biosynthesis